MSVKIWFMNAWNVGGALQNPKNMMVGSKSPMGLWRQLSTGLPLECGCCCIPNECWIWWTRLTPSYRQWVLGWEGVGRHFGWCGSSGIDSPGKVEEFHLFWGQRRKGKLGGILRGLSVQSSDVLWWRICKFPSLLGWVNRSWWPWEWNWDEVRLCGCRGDGGGVDHEFSQRRRPQSPCTIQVWLVQLIQRLGLFGLRWWFCWFVPHLTKLVSCLVGWRFFDLHPVLANVEGIIGVYN